MPVKLEDTKQHSILDSLYRCERRQDSILRAFEAHQRANYDDNNDIDKQLRLLLRVTGLETDGGPRATRVAGKGETSEDSLALRLAKLESRCETLEAQLKTTCDLKGREGSGRTEVRRSGADSVQPERYCRSRGSTGAGMSREPPIVTTRTYEYPPQRASAVPKTQHVSKRNNLTVYNEPKSRSVDPVPARGSRLVKVNSQWIRAP